MVRTNLLNLTEDVGNDILLDSLEYWSDKTPTDIPLLITNGYSGKRLHKSRDTSDVTGLSSKGIDFRLRECRSCISIMDPRHDLIKNYIEFMKNRHGIVNLSGSHFMDENGFIQWHTNQHERPGYNYRVYVTNNEKRGSVFKYILPDTNKVISYEEPIGWYAKVFSIEKELLHCVKANGPRYSFGLFF